LSFKEETYSQRTRSMQPYLSKSLTALKTLSTDPRTLGPGPSEGEDEGDEETEEVMAEKIPPEEEEVEEEDGELPTKLGFSIMTLKRE